MGIFDRIKDAATWLVKDETAANTLYTRQRSADEILRLQFRLPEPETLMARAGASVRILPLGVHVRDSTDMNIDETWEGTTSLSESFVVFEALENPRLLRFVLPLSTVRRVERLPSQSSVFAFKMTLYQDVQLVLMLDGAYSNCKAFCDLLAANLKAQIPLAKRLRQISASFYSEYLVESAALRKRGATRAEVQANVAVPSGGLGREFGYPGNTVPGRERAKMRLWLEYFGMHGRNIGLIQQPQFLRLIRVGIPNALRGEMWEVCSGAVHLRMKQRQLYTSILEENAGRTSQAAEEIAKDLNRSLPEFPAYQSPVGIEKLRRVLTAYSWMCPELGYCQAMNIVTAALLIYQTEEQAFWTLHVLVNRVLPGYYSRTMYGMLLDQKVLECLVEQTMPVLWQHLQLMDVPLSVVSLPWFLSLFANSMPLPFAFRVIDILMLEGSTALFQVALAVLRVNGEALLRVEDNTVVIEILKRYFDTLGELASPRAGMKQVTRFQQLMSTAFKEFSVVTGDHIHALRAKHERGVLEDIEAYAKRTQLRNIAKPRNLTQQQMGVVYDTFYAALQATRPGLGGNQGELSYYQFVTFLSQLVDWAHPRVTAREDAESHTLLRRLFNDWDQGNTGSLTLGDCMAGLSKLVEPEMMELMNYIYALYANDKTKKTEKKMETKTEKEEEKTEKKTDEEEADKKAQTEDQDSHDSNEGLTNRGILELADGLLLMMRPFSEVHNGAIVLDAQTSRKLANHGVLEEEERAAWLEKLQQQQSAQYLGSVSEFIQRAFEVAGLKAVQPKKGKAEVVEAPELIDINENAVKLKGSASGRLSLPHFRMVVLANETLELFFESTLRSTIHLTPQGTGVLSGSMGNTALHSIMGNIMRDCLEMANGWWQGDDDEVKDDRDELGDDVTVKASDRALLDL